jgi:hypothetical protein
LAIDGARAEHNALISQAAFPNLFRRSMAESPSEESELSGSETGEEEEEEEDGSEESEESEEGESEDEEEGQHQANYFVLFKNVK